MTTTPTEHLLYRLCRTSFLQFWTHLHPHRERGKELCDVIAIFENDIFLFSDKAIAFDDRDPLDKAWSDWHEEAVQAAIKQLHGAERRLRQTWRVFSDSKAQVPLPLNLPPREKARIHRIAVVHGAAAACRRECGGSGSLMVSTTSDGPSVPFAVHVLDESKGLVHVFDEVSLPIVLGELDTMPEFRDYLLCKEELFARGIGLLACGEEDLLARYLRCHHDTDAQRHGFGDVQGFKLVAVLDPLWSEFRDSEERRSRIAANSASYAWDDLIERFAGHAIAGTQRWATPGGPARSEQSLRVMAAEPRTMRRLIVDRLIAMATSDIAGSMRIIRMHAMQTGTTFTFLFLDQPNEMAYDDYRELRYRVLECVTYETSELVPESRQYLGIAMTTTRAFAHSEDMALLPERPLGKHIVEVFERLLPLLPPRSTTGTVIESVSEYPEPTGGRSDDSPTA